MTDPSTPTAQIDATIAALPADQRAALQALRETIAAAAPEAVDTISYGMPAFRYHGRALVAYAAFRAHCSLFPMSSALIEAHRDELAGFATAKGTLRFTPEHPLPKDLVDRFVRERMAQIDSGGARRVHGLRDARRARGRASGGGSSMQGPASRGPCTR